MAAQTTISHLASTVAWGFPMDSCILSILSHPTLPPTNPGGLCGLHVLSTLEGVPTPTPIETSGELPDSIIAPCPELIAAKIDPLSLWSSTACENLCPHVSNPRTAPRSQRICPFHGPHHITRPKSLSTYIRSIKIHFTTKKKSEYSPGKLFLPTSMEDETKTQVILN